MLFRYDEDILKSAYKDIIEQETGIRPDLYFSVDEEYPDFYGVYLSEDNLIEAEKQILEQSGFPFDEDLGYTLCDMFMESTNASTWCTGHEQGLTCVITIPVEEMEKRDCDKL